MKKSSCVLSLSLSLILVMVSAVTSVAMNYQESPMLTELVEQGGLPTIDERLPLEPFVVGPGVLVPKEDLDWQVGKYGGTLRSAHLGRSNDDFNNLTVEPLLIGSGVSAQDIGGNILQGFDVNEDYTLFTFYLREGLRWSDGYPVTTEDVRFTYEDVFLNEYLTPRLPSKFRGGGRADGEPMDLEIIDEYSFSVSFDRPYGAFIAGLAIAGWTSYNELLKPKHHLKQFHPTYTSMEEIQPYIEEMELDDEWWTVFHSKDIAPHQIGWNEFIGFPVLFPWVPVESSAEVIVLERNPYYFKVDIEGNQLPYIDRLYSVEVNDLDMITMKTIVGEMDLNRNYTALNNMPVYLENEEGGGYQTFILDHHAPTALTINPTFDEPAWQEVVGDVRFRKALSHAIDRQEIVDSIYLGFATPSHLVPGDYDLAKAKGLLDEIGMDQRDDDGYRLSPSGEPFHIYLEVVDLAPDFIPMAELLTEHFKELGINTSMRQISFELRMQRASANELMATLGWLHSEMWREQGWDDYLPGGFWLGSWGIEWVRWMNSQGESGVEPPAEIKELYEIHNEIMSVIAHTPEGDAAMDRLFDWYSVNVPLFLPAESVGYPLIAANSLRNVPQSGYGIAANRSVEQFFFAE